MMIPSLSWTVNEDNKEQNTITGIIVIVIVFKYFGSVCGNIMNTIGRGVHQMQ